MTSKTTKYSQLIASIRTATLALDVAENRYDAAIAAWLKAGMVELDDFAATAKARTKREKAKEALTLAKDALSRHCETVRAEWEAMHEQA